MVIDKMIQIILIVVSILIIVTIVINLHKESKIKITDTLIKYLSKNMKQMID
ncbi:hypothetical protein [Clostridioides difficile]|uniref:hypothetical protein n=1 Tax=Clostridioides difficile TaxID=1496 RepID=UPI000AE1FBCC|nr:hypothetical protein [Clostridioides difficile]